MTKNPLINALAAVLYITLVASTMFYGKGFVGPEDSVIMPIAMLSLLTLSTAIMGYLFLYAPFQLYLDGEKKRALNLFLQTLGVFACITILIFFALFALY